LAPAVAANYRAGDRVAAPFGTQFLDSVIIHVDPSSPYPYRVHPLGYLDTMDSSFSAVMLHAPGSVHTQPDGGIANDPWLMKVSARKAFHPATLYPGAYECWSFNEAVMILNFSIIDAHHYRDHAGAVAGYDFNAQSGAVMFHGGTLNGQQASYEQPSNPPNANNPPTVTLKASGDSCQLHF
jgi:hypothetical protein